MELSWDVDSVEMEKLGTCAGNGTLAGRGAAVMRVLWWLMLVFRRRFVGHLLQFLFAQWTGRRVGLHAAVSPVPGLIN